MEVRIHSRDEIELVRVYQIEPKLACRSKDLIGMSFRCRDKAVTALTNNFRQLSLRTVDGGTKVKF